jgi:ABC-type Fe3+ transport system substrate-binding protein
MKAFMARLSDHVGGLIRQSEEHRIVSGEFQMLVLANTHGVKQLAATGAPVASLVPEDVAQVGTMYLGVPRNSAHPNLAKLYINAVMSEPGQRVLYETYYADHYQLPGSQSAAELTELTSKGVQIQKVNIPFINEHPELPEVARDLQNILRERRG